MEFKRLGTKTLLGVFLSLAIISSCGNLKVKITSITAKAEKSKINVPEFNADSAYAFIQKQVEFGPRVPNSKAHKTCGAFLTKKLESFGAKVYTQEVGLEGYSGEIYESKNIIGSFNPNHPDRVILCAHWDSRHVADSEKDELLAHKPIAGANDGASGVGVILEMARLFQEQPPSLGVDLILFDSEDQGTPAFVKGNHLEDTWCLGSQYWAKNPHIPNYKAKYGVLIDMVGAEDAVFPKEGVSMYYAESVTNKVWDIAAKLGYSNLFVNQLSNPVTDDHYYINKLAGIPCIDIIHYSPGVNGDFGAFWHTHDDNMKIINKRTLKAVGDVLTELIYVQP